MKLKAVVDRKKEIEDQLHTVESSDETRTIGAFVTFNTVDGLQKCLNTFNSSPFDRCFRACKEIKDKELLFEGKDLQAHSSDDPNSVLW